MDSVSLYINFALNAILGRLQEADALMKIHVSSIRNVASALNRMYPTLSKPLYRGMLLDPAIPFKQDLGYTFLSWSEDRDVAEWFACEHSVISEHVKQLKPKFRGYIATLPTPRSRVLFHHSWAQAFEDLAPLALQHPKMGPEGARQIAWSLQTQSEVITEPVHGLEPIPVLGQAAYTIESLNRRFAPPWTR